MGTASVLELRMAPSLFHCDDISEVSKLGVGGYAFILLKATDHFKCLAQLKDFWTRNVSKQKLSHCG